VSLDSRLCDNDKLSYALVKVILTSIFRSKPVSLTKIIFWKLKNLRTAIISLALVSGHLPNNKKNHLKAEKTKVSAVFSDCA